MPILTNELLEAAMSDNGGWNAAQMKVLGLNGFEKGWRKRVTNSIISDAAYADLVALRNVHLVRGDTKDISFCEKDAWALETREKLLVKKNRAEEHVQRLLESSPFVFRREQPISVNEKKWFIDFHIRRMRIGKNTPSIRIALEIDGGYHFTPDQMRVDRRKDADLLCSEMIRCVVRISAERALSMDLITLSGTIINTKPFGTIMYY